MDSDQLIDLVHHYTDQIELLKREVVDATQTCARIIDACGGRVEIAEKYWLKDYELIRYERPDHVTIFAAREVTDAKPGSEGDGRKEQ